MRSMRGALAPASERFARQVGRFGDNALVLSGVATLFDVSAMAAQPPPPSPGEGAAPDQQ
jgi:hypothetical protein